MTKNEILNSDSDARLSAAGNPNTPVEVLTELAKDSSWSIRRSAAGNPNTPVEEKQNQREWGREYQH